MKYKKSVLPLFCALLLAVAGCSSLNKMGDHFTAQIAEKTGDKYYSRQDYKAAFTEYQQAANLEEGYGQFMLALMYLEGKGVEKNHEKYVFWMSKSAANGYPSANLAMGHEKMRSDPAAAASYFKKAAESEHGGAMYALGYLYATGYGVEQSDHEALRWFRLAQAQSYPVSPELLDETTIRGYVARDMQKAKQEKQYSQKEIVTFIQKQLASLGYKPGVADGVYGKKTKTAIEAFQKDHNIKVDGVADRALMEKLNTAQAQ